MLHVVDSSLVLAIARGDTDVIHRLFLMRKGEVAVPEPVLVHTGVEARLLPEFDAFERWQAIIDVMPRLLWTPDVTEAVFELEPLAGRPVDLDTITAAHAMASKGAVFTREPERYNWIRKLRIVAV